MLGTRFGRVLPLRVGFRFLVLALTLLAAVHGAPWTLYAWMRFMGVGLAFAFAALGALVIDHSAPRRARGPGAHAPPRPG